MRRIPDNAECAEVLIGGIKSLTRPVMAFVRLSEGQHMSKRKISICTYINKPNFVVSFCYSQYD